MSSAHDTEEVPEATADDGADALQLGQQNTECWTTLVKIDEEEVNVEELESKKILFSKFVQTAIENVIETNDPLDAPDFNAVDYINELFPNEQSLSNIDDVLIKMECEVTVIDDNIRTVVRSQKDVSEDGHLALKEAKNTLDQMDIQIMDIQRRAKHTEESIKEITRDIKRLDCAKHNLTTAITTLNHLHMLISGIDNLNKLIEKRLYCEILNPLQAVTEVNQHFQQYCDIPKIKVAHNVKLKVVYHQRIKKLSNDVDDIHNTLAIQITTDFHSAFGPSSLRIPLQQLTDACKIVSVLDPKVKRDLLKWFLTLQLEEYVQLFHENQDIAWLDRIDKRYAWLKRHLLDFESKIGEIFPSDWEVSERVTVEFCNITRAELTKIMNKRRSEIDVKLLLFAINKTQNFEQLLAKRFTGITLQENNLSGLDDKKDNEIKNEFFDLIGACFKAHLDIYTDSIDKNLTELIERFIEQAKTPFDPIITKSPVFPSCGDLFVFYKKCMVQCSQLSNAKPMYDLAMIFKKYLREYAIKVIEANIPKAAVQNPISANVSFRDLQNLSTAAGQVIHNFLKESEASRLSKPELIRTCCLLATSEYCLETVQQLEDKLKEKIEKTFADKIDLMDEQDLFHKIISYCIQNMVQDLENGCEPALTVMSKIQWQNITNVGDQSAFVNSMNQHFKQIVPIIRDNLSTSRKYYIQFCHKFINQFIPKFFNNLYKCKLTSSDIHNNILGCEQLLLDTHSIKTILLDLPKIGSLIERKPPPSYTNAVVKGMTRAEMIIKIVMTPVIPQSQFNKQILKLLPDIQTQEYQKILDMKGLKRSEQVQLVELLKKTVQENKTNNAMMMDEDIDEIVKKTAKLIISETGDDNSVNKSDNGNSTTNIITAMTVDNTKTSHTGTIPKSTRSPPDNQRSTFANILSGSISGVQQIGTAVGNVVNPTSSASSSSNNNTTGQKDRRHIKKLENLIKKHLPN